MEKKQAYASVQPARRHNRSAIGKWLIAGGAIALLGAASWYLHKQDLKSWRHPEHHHDFASVVHLRGSPYGRFPLPDDPFKFIPCTNTSLPPPLNDPHPEDTWEALFDPRPSHWSWGNKTTSTEEFRNPYAGRGIYLCGYLDVPLDYTNDSDTRIVRLAVTKYQVSGLARIREPLDADKNPVPGTKSKRTIVIEPGGPGGSGTSYAWSAAERVSKRFSNGTFDVLGWDPRGVNTTHPSISCFPYDVDRDHWSLLTGQYLEVSDPKRQLNLADAMNNATMNACFKKYGDVPRFLSTTSVARDMEQIRKALGERELTGYLVSYGTGIGQTYANIFPHSVGRMILDGTEYVRDHRLLGGFGWTALDNATNAWHDGFLGECLNAGPNHCALAREIDGYPVALDELESRMLALVDSLIDRPVMGYTNTSGPSLVTYSGLVGAIYRSLYNAQGWPALAQMLAELEQGNATLAARALERSAWEYDPTLPATHPQPASSDELGTLVICADSWDAPQPADGLDWWASLWANMTAKSWVSGNSRFFNVFPCRHFGTYWPEPAGVYRGDLNHTLRHPMLLIAETYDPATPLRNGRRLLKEMGRNARLVAHHGYGHSSRDTSKCTEAIARRYIMTGEVPEEAETACYADEKPYLYGVKHKTDVVEGGGDPVEVWLKTLD
ncbi:putative hydrolase YuaR [Colletotrichum tropicale]|nr:putative hydrolase YuaR [Colletotrichum tropicale]